MTKSRTRYETKCCVCDQVFYACKSLAQETGLSTAGHGSCPQCDKFLSLSFNETTNKMDTLKWEDYLEILKETKYKDICEDENKE